MDDNLYPDSLSVLQANIRKAVRDCETTTVGGGVFSAQELDTANKQIDALRDRVASLEASAISQALSSMAFGMTRHADAIRDALAHYDSGVRPAK